MNRAEKRVADAYGLEKFSGDWCDLINPRTGAKYEVKSAETDRQFRLWRDQHRSLLSSNARGTAWYVFVSGSRAKRMKPETVSAIVKERGGWNKSGHIGRKKAKQLKVPVDVILD